MDSELEMLHAWREAARDLCVQLTTPYMLRGQTYPLLVHCFGGRIGTLPLVLHDHRYASIPSGGEYFASQMNPEFYCRYDRKLFVETLLDWGWFGAPDAAPDWYRHESSKAEL